MFDLMAAIGGRLQTILEADGGELFPAPGDRVTAIPALYYRNYPPRQRNPQNPEHLPAVVIYRTAGKVGFCPTHGMLCVLWEMYNPYDEGTADIDIYQLGEQSIDRANDIMEQVLKVGRTIGDWDLGNAWDVEYGSEGRQANNYSAVEYKIQAVKTRG